MLGLRGWGPLLTRCIKWGKGFRLLEKFESNLGVGLGLFVMREGGTKVDVDYKFVLFSLKRS